MNANKFAVGLCGLAIWTSAPAYSQQTTVAPNDDPKRLLVGRLDLERYKVTLRGLGQCSPSPIGSVAVPSINTVNPRKYAKCWRKIGAACAFGRGKDPFRRQDEA